MCVGAYDSYLLFCLPNKRKSTISSNKKTHNYFNGLSQKKTFFSNKKNTSEEAFFIDVL